jgi:hypothetical protein
MRCLSPYRLLPRAKGVPRRAEAAAIAHAAGARPRGALQAQR